MSWYVAFRTAMVGCVCPLYAVPRLSAQPHPDNVRCLSPTSHICCTSNHGRPNTRRSSVGQKSWAKSSAWLLMLIWHMPECCSSAIAHARQGMQIFRSGLHVSRLLVDLQHLGRAIARIVCVCHMLCAGLDKGCAAVAGATTTTRNVEKKTITLQ